MANKTASVRARIEPSVKKRAERVLKKVGLSPSEAINVFYHHVAEGCAFPFSFHIPNEETRKAIIDAHKGKGVRMTLDAFAREVRTAAQRA